MRKGRVVRNLVLSTTVQGVRGVLYSTVMTYGNYCDFRKWWIQNWIFCRHPSTGHWCCQSFVGTRKTDNCQHILTWACWAVFVLHKELRMVVSSWSRDLWCLWRLWRAFQLAEWEPEPAQPGTSGAGLAAGMHLHKKVPGSSISLL